jgi:hypothetical protein
MVLQKIYKKFMFSHWWWMKQGQLSYFCKSLTRFDWHDCTWLSYPSLFGHKWGLLPISTLKKRDTPNKKHIKAFSKIKGPKSGVLRILCGTFFKKARLSLWNVCRRTAYTWGSSFWLCDLNSSKATK